MGDLIVFSSKFSAVKAQERKSKGRSGSVSGCMRPLESPPELVPSSPQADQSGSQKPHQSRPSH